MQSGRANNQTRALLEHGIRQTNSSILLKLPTAEFKMAASVSSDFKYRAWAHRLTPIFMIVDRVPVTFFKQQQSTLTHRITISNYV